MSRLLLNLRNVLDEEADEVRAMLEAGNCTFYTPESLGDVKLELFAVLRS